MKPASSRRSPARALAAKLRFDGRLALLLQHPLSAPAADGHSPSALMRIMITITSP